MGTPQWSSLRATVRYCALKAAFEHRCGDNNPEPLRQQLIPHFEALKEKSNTTAGNASGCGKICNITYIKKVTALIDQKK